MTDWRRLFPAAWFPATGTPWFTWTHWDTLVAPNLDVDTGQDRDCWDWRRTEPPGAANDRRDNGGNHWADPTGLEPNLAGERLHGSWRAADANKRRGPR